MHEDEIFDCVDLMLEKEMPTFAMNRVYYSMFYAIQATAFLTEDYK